MRSGSRPAAARAPRVPAGGVRHRFAARAADRPGHGAAAAENALCPGAAERPCGGRGPRHGRRGAPRRATARRAGRAGARGRARAERRGHAAVRDRPRALRAQCGARGRRSRRAGRDRHLRAGLQQAGAAGAAARRAVARLARQRRRVAARCAPPRSDGGGRGHGDRGARGLPRGDADRARQPAPGRSGAVRIGTRGRGRRERHRARAGAGRLGLDAAGDRRRAAGRADPGRRAGRIAGHLGDRSPARDRAPAGGRPARGRRPARPSTRSRSSTAPEAPPRACA